MRYNIGWRHVLPWSIGLVSLFVLTEFIIGWAIKSEVVRAGQRRVGARVDVGDATISLASGVVSLKDLQIANPLAPQRNLVAADRCDFALERGELLRKQVIVHYGVVTGLRFGTPRDVSGALGASAFSADEPAGGWLDEASLKTAHDWLDSLHKKFDHSLISQLESIRLTKELFERWPQHSAELEARAVALRQQTVDFRAEVREAQKNPLRHIEFLNQMPDQLAAFRDNLVALGREIEDLPNLAETDRRAIVAARDHDEQLLRDELKFEPIDPNVLSAYLLQEQLDGPLKDVFGWLRLVRRIVPADDEPIAGRQRGHDIVFTGCQPTPRLLVRTLRLEGTTQFAGQPVEYFGTLTGASDRPALVGTPMQVKLSTRGDRPLELLATIDRSGTVPRDELLVNFESLVLPKIRLGGSDKLRLSLSSAEASLNIRITVAGDKITGDVTLVQKQVDIEPQVGAELAHLHADKTLAKSLGKIHSLSTHVAIDGTLAAPACHVESDLGPQVATALGQAFSEMADGFSREVLAQSQERVNRRLAEFDRQLATVQQDLAPQLADSNTALDQLANGTEPGPRLTIEHLGRRLPADSLFR